MGGGFSMVEMAVALYYDFLNWSPEKVDDPDRDRFILSKGHISDAYYAVLAMAGYLPEEELMQYTLHGSRLSGHPTNHVPGIEVNTG